MNELVCCPECGSHEWDRVLWFFLKNEIIGQKNKNKFLYVSANRFIYEKLKRYLKEVDVTSLLYFNTQNINSEDRLAGGKYDVIIFVQLLQFVEDEIRVLGELRRLLRTGGFVLIMTIVNKGMDRTYEKPVTDEDKDRLTKYYYQGLERVYGMDLVKRLVKAGFEVEVIDYADQLGNSARAFYKLGDGSREMIFKCKKR